MSSPAPTSANADSPAPADSRLPPWVRALRLHQWAKNLLVIIPPLAAHRFSDPRALEAALAAFAAFGLAASGGYLINDLRDVASDRTHPRKRLRPVAAGALSERAAAALAGLLFAAAAAVSWRLPTLFRALLAGYVVATFAYSLGLKRRPVLDVLVLAALYTVRLFAGGAAAGTPVSEWLASFSMFVFVSLALLKRSAELARASAPPAGRGYRLEELPLLAAMGVAAAFVSVLVLALYVSSDAVTRLYSQPRWLWLLCPLALYWLSRLWLLAFRGEVDEDPVLFTLRDRESLAVVLAAGAVVVMGI